MKEIKVTKENANQRVDKFVRKYLNLAPLSFIYRVFRKKDIKINDHWVKENYILQEGDDLKIYVTDSQIEEFNKPKDITNLKSNLNIIYEDDQILILNKPKGILVQGDAEEKRITLTNHVRSYLYNKGEFKNDGKSFNPSPVHRLDRNTSGVCIFAKTLNASQVLMDLFKDRDEIDKYYLALVFGEPKQKEGLIDAPLLKNEETKIVKVASIKEGAKTAKTEYKLVASNGNISLLKVHLLTGRTHQIRVHLSFIGCPIVGDPKYGNFKLNKDFEKKYAYNNQFLHSYKFKFKNLDGDLKYLSNKSFFADLYNKEQIILDDLGIHFTLKD